MGWGAMLGGLIGGGGQSSSGGGMSMMPWLKEIQGIHNQNMARRDAIHAGQEARQHNVDMFRLNEKEAQKARDFTKYMSNTQMERRVKDLQSAGLNPLMALTDGASVGSATAATGSGGASGPVHEMNTDPSNVMSNLKQVEAIKNAKQTMKNLKAQEKQAKAQEKYIHAQTAKTNKETKVLGHQERKSSVYGRFWDRVDKSIDNYNKEYNKPTKQWRKEQKKNHQKLRKSRPKPKTSPVFLKGMY